MWTAWRLGNSGPGQVKASQDLFGTMKPPTIVYVAEYNRWRADVLAMPEDVRKKLKPAVYWHENKDKYGQLWDTGLWYSCYEVSSVEAERAFGIMRHVEAPNRLAMKEPAWQAEMFLKY